MAAAPDLRRATAVERQPTAPEARTTQSMYEQYAGQIYGFCFNQLGSREEAEDAVQSTFMNAFRGLQRGVVPEAESAWLFKIAHNVCLSRRRAAFRRGRVEFANDLEAIQEITPSPSPGRSADELIRLNDVLATMPENQRKAILLREWQGLSYHEIAAEMELSQAAVETLIFRARRSLADGLEAADAPRKGWKRLRTGSNLGSLLVALKSLLVGSAAVVAAGSVAGSGTLEHHRSWAPRDAEAPAPARAHTRTPAGVPGTHDAAAPVSATAAGTVTRADAPARTPARAEVSTPRTAPTAAAERPAQPEARQVRRALPAPPAAHATRAVRSKTVAPPPVRPCAGAAPAPASPPAAAAEPQHAPASAAPPPPEPQPKAQLRAKPVAPPPAPDPAVVSDTSKGKGKHKDKDKDKGNGKADGPKPKALEPPRAAPAPLSPAPASEAGSGHEKKEDVIVAAPAPPADPADAAANPVGEKKNGKSDEHGKDKEKDNGK